MPPKTRKGALLVVSGSERTNDLENARHIVKKLFATLDIEYFGDLFIGGSDIMDKASGKKDDAMKRAFELGASLARGI